MTDFTPGSVIPPEGQPPADDTTVITQPPQTVSLPAPEPQTTTKVYKILDESAIDFHPVLTIFASVMYGFLALFWYVPAYLALIQLTYTGDIDRARILSQKIEKVSWWLIGIAAVICIAIMIFGALM